MCEVTCLHVFDHFVSIRFLSHRLAMGKRKCVFNVKHRSAINATASANIRDFLKPKMGEFFQLWGTFGLQKGVDFQYLLLNIC
jgi:hypothetical protein